MNDIVIMVTKEHLSLGDTESADGNAIALAVRMRLPGAEVEAHPNTIVVRDPESRPGDAPRVRYYDTDIPLREWMRLYCAGKRMAPFRFVMYHLEGDPYNGVAEILNRGRI